MEWVSSLFTSEEDSMDGEEVYVTEDETVEEASNDDDDDDDDEDDEIEDPMNTLKEKCQADAGCKAVRQALEACTARVESKSNTTEICLEEFQDFVFCVDHCVAKDLFHHLK